MRTSEQIDQLAAALALAAADIRPAIKDANNPAFNSKYADLGAVFDAAKPALTKHGLVVVQMPAHSDDALLHLTTRVMHKSGQWVEGTMSIPVGKVNAHGYGSAITYARRYAFSAALGIVADEDDDGNKAAADVTPAARVIAGNKTPGREAFDALSDEGQKFVTEYADVVTNLYDTKGDVMGYIAMNMLDSDEKTAMWSLLRSDIRSAIKRSAAETKPKEAA